MATKPRNTKPAAAPAATEAPAAPESPAKPVESPAAPALVAALLKAGTALARVETAAAKAIARTRSEQMPATLDAWRDYGLALKPIIDAHASLTWDDVSGAKLAKAIDAGLIAEADRATLPTGATACTKALTVARHDSAGRRSAFLKAGNAPDSDEYVVWLGLTTTGAPGSNRSTIDVRASLINPADWDETAADGKGAAKPGAAIGLIVRGAKPAAGAGGSSKPAVPPAIAKVLAVRDDRAKLAKVPPVIDLTAVAPDQWDGFVAQVLADYLLHHAPVVGTDGAAAPALKALAPLPTA